MRGSGPDILHLLRGEEMEAVYRWLPSAARVLELGGGDGYQAGLLAARGYTVSSIDVAGRPKAAREFHPVQEYDGVHIPFADRTFDVVFSSNVLEHIRDLPATLREVRRVLRDGGVAVHLVPSASWRLWTTVAHYPWLTIYPFRAGKAAERVAPDLGKSLARNTLSQLAKKALGFAPHGEYPNAFAELYYFRRARWERFLRAQGFELVHSGGNSLFYTGYALAPALPLTLRRYLSRVLGSACHLFVTSVDRNNA